MDYFLNPGIECLLAEEVFQRPVEAEVPIMMRCGRVVDPFGAWVGLPEQGVRAQKVLNRDNRPEAAALQVPFDDFPA